MENFKVATLVPLSYYEALGFLRQLHLSSAEITLIVVAAAVGLLLSLTGENRKLHWTKIMISIVILVVAYRDLTETTDSKSDKAGGFRHLLALMGCCGVLILAWVDDICHCGAVLFQKLVDSPDNRSIEENNPWRK